MYRFYERSRHHWLLWILRTWSLDVDHARLILHAIDRLSQFAHALITDYVLVYLDALDCVDASSVKTTSLALIATDGDFCGLIAAAARCEGPLS